MDKHFFFLLCFPLVTLDIIFFKPRSPTGLPSKRGPGLESFSRADRGIGGVRGPLKKRKQNSTWVEAP